MLVKDHTAANEKVKSLAAARNLTLPKTPSDAQQDTMKTCCAKPTRNLNRRTSRPGEGP